jgi:hypothetical protein
MWSVMPLKLAQVSTEPLRLTSIHLHDENCRFFCSIFTCLISGLRREADDNCALLGYYAASSGNFLPTFLDNLPVPISRVKNKKKLNFWPLKMGPIICSETSVRNYHYSQRNNTEERSCHHYAFIELHSVSFNNTLKSISMFCKRIPSLNSWEAV